MYCDICYIHLCTTCGGEHLLDESKGHKVVPFKNRGSSPKCPKHSTKLCELHCEKCDILICSLCVSSTEHEGHKLIDYTLKIIETKKGIETRVKGIHKIYLS